MLIISQFIIHFIIKIKSSIQHIILNSVQRPLTFLYFCGDVYDE